MVIKSTNMTLFRKCVCGKFRGWFGPLMSSNLANAQFGFSEVDFLEIGQTRRRGRHERCGHRWNSSPFHFARVNCQWFAVTVVIISLFEGMEMRSTSVIALWCWSHSPIPDFPERSILNQDFHYNLQFDLDIRIQSCNKITFKSNLHIKSPEFLFPFSLHESVRKFRLRSVTCHPGMSIKKKSAIEGMFRRRNQEGELCPKWYKCQSNE